MVVHLQSMIDKFVVLLALGHLFGLLHITPIDNHCTCVPSTLFNISGNGDPALDLKRA